MTYAREDHITVHPFTRQPDGESIIIGRPDTNVFLALPREAVEIIDQLAAGKRIGEAQDAFAAAHGELPDIAELLGYLEQRGFVGSQRPDAASSGAHRSASPTAPARPVRYHFASIPQAAAQAFFRPTAIRLFLLLVALALLAAAVKPSLVPGPRSLFFSQHRSIKFLVVTFIAYLTTFVHEFWHLLAARAAGVQSRIGISNRLWVLVAETDLTGLWALPKEKRYLPLLAGAMSDLASAAVLMLVLFAQSTGYLALSASAIEILSAVVFVYLMRILWQCFFFVRTDFYFVLANFFSCKNLMGDTQAMLRNQLARIIPGLSTTNQDHIPARERRVVATYSILWIAGRALAFGTLFLVMLPVLQGYLGNLVAALQRGYAANPYDFADAVTINLVNALPLAVGLSLWLASLLRRKNS